MEPTIYTPTDLLREARSACRGKGKYLRHAIVIGKTFTRLHAWYLDKHGRVQETTVLI